MSSHTTHCPMVSLNQYDSVTTASTLRTMHTSRRTRLPCKFVSLESRHSDLLEPALNRFSIMLVHPLLDIFPKPRANDLVGWYAEEEEILIGEKG